MAERKFLFMSSDGWSEEAATTDSLTLGGLTMGGDIDMNSAGKVVNANAASTAGDVLVYGQSSASLAGLTLTGDLAMGSNKITGLASGTDDNDAVTRVQLNSVAAGLQVKEAVKAATTASLPSYTFDTNVMTADSNGAFPSQDGVSISLNDRILVKDESGAYEEYNGIYYLSQVGDVSNPWKLTRTADADTDAEVNTGMTVHVDQGTNHGNQNWTLTTNAPITLNTTALAFTLFSTLADLAAGNGIDITSNTVSAVANANAGIVVDGSGIAVDLASAGAGTGGLEFDGSGDLQVLDGNGITLTASGVEAHANTNAGIAVDGSGIAVDLASAGAGTGGLEFDGSGDLQVLDGNGIELTASGVAATPNTAAGVSVDASGIAVDLASAGAGTGGLQFDGSGDVEVNAATAAGIELTASGVAVNLESDAAIVFDGVNGGLEVNLETTNPTLEVSSNELGVKYSSTASGLDQDSNGLKVKVDSSTITINGSGQLVSVGADEATRVENDWVASETVSAGDPVYFDSTGDQIGQAQAGTDSKAWVFGVAKTGISASYSGAIVSYGPCAGVLSSATPGQKYYLASGGGLSTSAPSGNNRVILVGWAINADDLWVQPIDFGKKAA